jgi:hypothetical protein
VLALAPALASTLACVLVSARIAEEEAAGELPELDGAKAAAAAAQLESPALARRAAPAEAEAEAGVAEAEAEAEAVAEATGAAAAAAAAAEDDDDDDDDGDDDDDDDAADAAAVAAAAFAAADSIRAVTFASFAQWPLVCSVSLLTTFPHRLQAFPFLSSSSTTLLCTSRWWLYAFIIACSSVDPTLRWKQGTTWHTTR